MNHILKEDFNTILSCSQINWDHYRNSSFLITGATGLVGSLIVKLLVFASQNLNLKMRIYVLVRDLEKTKTIFGSNLEEQGIIPVVGDVRDDFEITDQIDYIIHAASITESKLMVRHPIDTFLIAVDGTKQLLETAVKHKVRNFLYISSMEMYGVTQKNDNPVDEDKLGYVDLKNVRTSYQEGKRAAEFLCTAYFAEKKVPVKIARLAQTFGAGVLETEKRIFAQFARSVIERKDIVLHTKGQSIGNYCYTADMLLGLLYILEKGENGQAYNVVNENNTMSIKEMAELVCDQLADHKINVVFDIPESSLTYGYAPDVVMRLSGQKLRNIGWIPKVPIIDMYKRMIHYWGYAL